MSGLKLGRPSGEIRARQKRFQQTENTFQTNRWSDAVSDPIPFVPQTGPRLSDQDILDEFHRRSLMSRFHPSTLVKSVPDDDLTEAVIRRMKASPEYQDEVLKRMAVHGLVHVPGLRTPKYVAQLRELLARYYGQGQGFSPSALAHFAFTKGITNSKGGQPDLGSALAWLVDSREVIKHSNTHYQWVAATA